VDFDLDSDQSAIVSAVGAILDRHAGADRMRELGGDGPRYDHELDGMLAERGFLDLVDGTRGHLEAALVAETIANRLGVIAAGARLLVAPVFGPAAGLVGPIAVVTAHHTGPVRFLADARTILVVETDAVRVVKPEPGTLTPVRSRMGYPMGQLIDEDRIDCGSRLDVDPDRVTAWWRVAVAAELVGTMRAVLDRAVDHVTNRRQFDRAIGSFQAVQHRLAECAVAIEGSRWLMLEAAWRGAPAEAAAAALTQASTAAHRVFTDAHQFHGAMGFTTEHDLHLWTVRLPALTIEARSLGRPATALARARWGAG
jgi:Acyl-CoA dehydrogenase, C-terminal domain